MKKAQTTCTDCGAPFPPPPPVGATGYATLPSGKRICYSCADKRQREALRDRTQPFVGYVHKNKDDWNSKGEIISWTGGHLMSITRRSPVRLPCWSRVHGKGFDAIRARDVHGGLWWGRGSDGVAIVLRALKD